MNIEKRNIGMCIVFSLLTCGIYYIYWFYKILDDLYKINMEESKAGMDILFSIITCGIYSLYIHYVMGKKINSARISKGLTPKDDGVLYLVLAFFGLTIVAACIVQSNLNDDFANSSYMSIEDDRRN